ncbi:MAG: AI-2E family transporter [Acidimicrobiia bacterium]|nr:AI-2E family transporter [Acidimicrobiia bacterium]
MATPTKNRGALNPGGDADRDLRRKVLLVVVTLLSVAAALWFSYQIRNVLFMLFVSVFVAVAMEPPVHTLSKRGWSRGAATGIVFLAAFLVVSVIAIALIPLVASQLADLIDGLPEYVESVANLLNDWFGLEFTESGIEDQTAVVQDWFDSNAGSVVGGVVGVGSTIFGFIFFGITVALFSFYMVAELPQLKRSVLSLLRQDHQRDALVIWDTAVEKMGGYIYSRLILTAIGATVFGLFLTALKVPFSIPLGIIVGVLSQFIPVVGTYIAAVLPAIVALSVDGGRTSLWVIVFFVAYQQLENFVISPRITQRTMSLHPAVSVAAIIIGGAVMGAIGIILALPVAAIIQAVVSTSLQRHEVVDHSAPDVASD